MAYLLFYSVSLGALFEPFIRQHFASPIVRALFEPSVNGSTISLPSKAGCNLLKNILYRYKGGSSAGLFLPHGHFLFRNVVIVSKKRKSAAKRKSDPCAAKICNVRRVIGVFFAYLSGCVHIYDTFSKLQ